MTLFRPDAKAFTALFRLFLMLVGVLVLNPDRAKADGYMDLSSGDSGCTDPMLPGFSANSHGGACLAFQNPSSPGGGGVPYDNLQFMTAFTHPETFFCSGGNVFMGCEFFADGVLQRRDPTTGGYSISSATELTILFSGIGGDHPGVPVDGFFTIDLNSPCPPTTANCNPFSRDGSGGWLLADGSASSFTGVANAPEPNMQILVLLAGVGLVLARKKLAGSRRQGSQEPERDIS
jgi:hypothetical protein